MKKVLALLMFCGTVWAGSHQANGQSTVVVDSTKEWLGFMNVSELPINGGAYVFGSPWETFDLVAEFSGSTLTLSPNVIEDPDIYWYQDTCNCAADPLKPGGPGQAGNKIMEANMYVEETDTLSGMTVTFEGNVLSNTLTSAHETIAFIKDFAPDYSTFNLEFAFLDTPGPFSFSLATDPGAGRHVQYGFQTVGVNVWSTDVAPFGNVQIEAVGSAGAPGDFDGDGDVDGHDFLVWQRDTNVGTLTDWQTNYGTPPLSANIASVPEPGTCALGFLWAVGVSSLSRRWY